MSDSLPLLQRFPALARIPRASLGDFPTPVERIDLGPGEQLAGELWIKRDDLTASPLGGNKIRALEFLLGGLAPGDVVLTAGGEGSTHVLTTATCVRALGGTTHAVRWKHEMNPSSHEVAARAREICASITTARGSVSGLVRAYLARRSYLRWIPLGGTSPLGMLGHVNAALELAEQITRGEIPRPARIVVPVGSGGTVAGLALGLAIAQLNIPLVGARVAPRMAAGRARVLALAERERRFIERVTGEQLAKVHPSRVDIIHSVYAGAYGRALPAAAAPTALLARTSGLRVDGTYSAKALTAAVEMVRRNAGVTLLWLTFDGRGA